MTITELADQVGVSRQTINAYELGQNSPRGENLVKLVEILQFPISFFYDEYHNQSPTGSAFFRSLKTWGVSIAAILHRAFSLGLITDNQNLYLNKLISKRRWRTTEPLDDIIPTEKPIVLKTAFNMVVDNNLRKPIDIFHDLNIPQDEICKICQIENIAFDTTSPTPVLRVIKNS